MMTNKARHASVPGLRFLIAIALLLGLASFRPVKRTPAQTAAGYVLDIREIETTELEAPTPAGLAFSPAANALLVMDNQSKGKANPGIKTITLVERLDSTSSIAGNTTDVLSNMAYNGAGSSLFLLNVSAQKLDRVPLRADGRLESTATVSASYNIKAYGVQNSEGMAFDPEDGRLFLLDPAGKRMIIVTPDENGSYEGDPAGKDGRIERIDLKHLGAKHLRGIAFNPGNAHLYVLDPTGQQLYELNDSGQLYSTRDLTPYALRDPQGMTFASSGDLTDDPDTMSLYIADSGAGNGKSPRPGEIIEFALEPPQAGFAVAQSNSKVGLSLMKPAVRSLAATTASLVRTIDTSMWSPPSPDPAGLDYNPLTGQLVASDSEVDEMAIFQNKNVFVSTPAGSLSSSCVTLPFSKEPTGVAANPSNGHIFFSDDGKDRIFEVNLGGDGLYCTGDDVVTFIDTTAFNSTDPEGITFGADNLFVADGLNKEIYVVNPGSNGIFDGVAPTGDDQVSNFDVAGMGLRDPEGIGFYPRDEPQNDTLFIVSRPDAILAEVTTSGGLVSTSDLAFLNAIALAGVAVGPGSLNPEDTNIYISARGVDNNDDPNENDGMIYEVTLGGSTPTPTPTPTATPTSPPGGDPILYLSLANSGSYTVGSVTGVRDEDILSFDGSSFAMFFDGSDVGVGSPDLDAFELVDADTLLMSFSSAVTIGGLVVDEWDIVQFDGSLGANTAGTFSLYFDGNDVGLDTTAEDIDALNVLPDGRILISTTGNPSVPDVSGPRDEDLLAFTPTTLGDSTAGAWAMYFDGTDVLLADSAEDTDAVATASNGNILLSTTGSFAVTGVSGENVDVFVCTPTSLGDTTACSFSSTLFFDGSAWGLTGNNVDAFEVPLVP